MIFYHFISIIKYQIEKFVPPSCGRYCYGVALNSHFFRALQATLLPYYLIFRFFSFCTFFFCKFVILLDILILIEFFED